MCYEKVSGGTIKCSVDQCPHVHIINNVASDSVSEIFSNAFHIVLFDPPRTVTYSIDKYAV